MEWHTKPYRRYVKNSRRCKNNDENALKYIEEKSQSSHLREDESEKWEYKKDILIKFNEDEKIKRRNFCETIECKYNETTKEIQEERYKYIDMIKNQDEEIQQLIDIDIPKAIEKADSKEIGALRAFYHKSLEHFKEYMKNAKENRDKILEERRKHEENLCGEIEKGKKS